MSHLFLRRRTVCIRFRDPYGRTRRLATGHTLEKVRKDPDGRVIWPSAVLDFKAKLDANLVLNRWDFMENEPVRIKISEALAQYHSLEGGTRARQTISLDKDALRQIVDFAGDVYLREIDETLLFRFRQHMIERASEYTAARVLRHLSGLLSWCVRKRMIERNPISAAVKVTPPRKPVVSFTDEELEQILKYFVKEGDPELARQLRFLALTGFRSGESCALRWDAVDLKTGQISHENVKGRRMEPYPVGRTLGALLRSSSRQWAPFVFKYRNVSTLSRRMHDAIVKLGLNPRLNVHALKKTYVRQLVQSGVPVPLLHSLSHHASLSTTLNYYVAFDLEAKRKALDAAQPGDDTKVTHLVLLKGPSRKK